MAQNPLKALLKVGYLCNNSCVFCHSAPHRGTDSSYQELERKIHEAASLGTEMLVLSGGEPTIRPDLLRIASAINTSGMSLGLVTNGRMLAYPDLVDRLLAHRLDYLHISLAGAESQLHNQHVRTESFDQTMQGLRLVAGRIKYLIANVIVTAWNQAQLENFLPVAKSIAPVRLKFSMLEPEGRALNDFEGLVPPLSQATELVIAVIEKAQREYPEVSVTIDGFPLCLVLRYQDLEFGLREDGFFMVSEAFENSWYPVDDRNKKFGSRCSDCSLRRRCRGVFEQYLLRRGEEELKPVSLPVSNSFNFFSCGRPERLSLDHCPIRAGRRPPPDPVHGIALMETSGMVQRHEATGRDFSDETLQHVVRNLGQVYLDKTSQVLLSDFPHQLTKLSLSVTCVSCPKKTVCGGVWQPEPDSPFIQAEQCISKLLATASGTVLDVGCGGTPYLNALEPALQTGRLRYIGIDPKASSGKAGPGQKLIQSTLEDFQWRGAPFDAVMALRSLNHLSSVRKGLKKMSALIAAGGRIILAEDVVFGVVRNKEITSKIHTEGHLSFEHRANLYLEETLNIAYDCGLKVLDQYSPLDTKSTLWILVLEK